MSQTPEERIAFVRRIVTASENDYADVAHGYLSELEAEIATLRQELQELREFRAEHIDAFAIWESKNTYLSKLVAAEAENARLRAGIQVLVNARRCDASVMVCGFLDDLEGLLANPAETDR